MNTFPVFTNSRNKIYFFPRADELT